MLWYILVNLAVDSFKLEIFRLDVGIERRFEICFVIVLVLEVRNLKHLFHLAHEVRADMVNILRYLVQPCAETPCVKTLFIIFETVALRSLSQ